MMPAKATTSGTSFTFNAPHPNPKGAILHIMGVGTNGTTDEFAVTLADAGGEETSGYSGAVFNEGATSTGWSTEALLVRQTDMQNDEYEGKVFLDLADTSTNTWSFSGSIRTDGATRQFNSGGTKSLSDTLTQIIFKLNGTPTDSFNAGKANVTWIY